MSLRFDYRRALDRFLFSNIFPNERTLALRVCQLFLVGLAHFIHGLTCTGFQPNEDRIVLIYGSSICCPQDAIGSGGQTAQCLLKTSLFFCYCRRLLYCALSSDAELRTVALTVARRRACTGTGASPADGIMMRLSVTHNIQSWPPHNSPLPPPRTVSARLPSVIEAEELVASRSFIEYFDSASRCKFFGIPSRLQWCAMCVYNVTHA